MMEISLMPYWIAALLRLWICENPWWTFKEMRYFFNWYADLNQLEKAPNVKYRSFADFDVILLRWEQHFCRRNSFGGAGWIDSNYHNDECIQGNMFDSQTGRNGIGSGDDFWYSENFVRKSEGKDIKNQRNPQDKK